MIAGPILPRTVDGLWESVRQDPGRLERGLRIVRRELVLEGGLVVDALAADAVGAPVLLFVAMVDRDRQLPGRIAEARAWFARNASLLAPVLEGLGVRADVPPRIFVVGFEFTESCLERLREDAADDLAVFRIEGLYVDGVRHVGAVRVLGSTGDAALGAEAHSTPAGHARRLAELLQRLDPDLAVDGDRYSRTWRLDGTTVIRLERDARRLRAVVPGEDEVELWSGDEVVEAFDSAMRRYLAILDGQAEPEEPPALVGAGSGTERHGAALGDFDTEVTPDEFEAFFADDPRGGLS